MYRNLFILLSAFLVSVKVFAGTALSGIYTIGTVPSDFATIQSAVNELNTNGISAPVEFRIKSGTYDEQVTINNFTRFGASDDSVIFRKVGPFDTVTWQYSAATSTTNWVIKINGAQYVTIRGITFESAASNYGDIIRIEGEASNNTVESSTFNGQLGLGNHIIQTGLGNHPDNQFLGNTFIWGDKAIDFDYQFGGSDSSGLVISGNTFSSQSLKAIETGSQGAVIIDNIFYGTTVSDPSYIGMDVNDNAAIIENNLLDISKGDAAIWVFHTGGLGTESRIANNLVALRSSTATRGIYVSTDNVSIYHNTVRSVSSTAPALYISADSHDIRIRNNILQNDANGLALRILSGSDIAESNYNNVYSSAVPVIEWNGSGYNNIMDYASASGLDLFSTSKSVNFVQTSGTNDLHLAPPSNNDADMLSPLLASVTLDFDGDTRGPNTTYKGADEGTTISPLDNADTANGFYTVGGASPDYANPSIAIDDLIHRGTKGPVTFRVRAGNYNVHKILNGINRYGNANDLIYFRTANVNNPPTFQFAASNTSDNWIIKMKEMNDVTFQYINFTSTATGNFGRLLALEGENSTITVSNSNMTGVTTTTDTSAALVYCSDTGQADLDFNHNNFNNGSTALYLAPAPFSSPRGQSLNVSNNTFTNQTAFGLYTDYDDISVNNNQVASSSNGVSAFYLQFNKNPQFNSNRILLTGNNSVGIDLNGSDGYSFANPAYISNNFIVAKTGIDLYASASLFYMYHNSIISDLFPIYANDSGGGLEIINNILINSVSGVALHVAEAADVDSSEGNNFLNASGSLIHWDGADYANLADFQAASATNLQSVSQPVTFQNQSLADLHLAGGSDGDLLLAGIPLADIATDYDAQNRSSNSPYMGADEATIELIRSYDVGGSLMGLLPGNSLTISNNGNDNLVLTQDGLFVFGNQIEDQTTYLVEVISEPSGPIQHCSVTGGENGSGGGTINGADVTNIVITCDNNDLIFRSNFDSFTASSSILNKTEDNVLESKGFIQPQVIPAYNKSGIIMLILGLLIISVVNGRKRI